MSVFDLLYFSTCLYIIVRNVVVYRARGAMLDRVADAADRDIDCRRDWLWRFSELAGTSYYRQLVQVGRPTWPRDPARTER